MFEVPPCPSSTPTRQLCLRVRRSACSTFREPQSARPGVWLPSLSILFQASSPYLVEKYCIRWAVIVPTRRRRGELRSAGRTCPAACPRLFSSAPGEARLVLVRTCISLVPSGVGGLFPSPLAAVLAAPARPTRALPEAARARPSPPRSSPKLPEVSRVRPRPLRAAPSRGDVATPLPSPSLRS